ncbi:hypothetical protein [Mycobacterium sp.]|uniref:hypothetical protein n=1 Tax=Mycobacterium sp. TaxID=1785 RepID=UPI002DAA16B3|nr:hypothetical protein [Mycobacterium sp.]
MWLTIAQIALIAVLVIGSATLVAVYVVRRRRGIEGWSPHALYSDLMGRNPKLPPPAWVDGPEDDGTRPGLT